MVCLPLVDEIKLIPLQASLRKLRRARHELREVGTAARVSSGSNGSETRRIARRSTPTATRPKHFHSRPGKEQSSHTSPNRPSSRPTSRRSKARRTTLSPRSRSTSSTVPLRTRPPTLRCTLRAGRRMPGKRVSWRSCHGRLWMRWRRPKRRAGMWTRQHWRKSSLGSRRVSSSPKRRSSVLPPMLRDRGRRKTRTQRIGMRSSRSMIIRRRRGGRRRTRSR